MLKNFIITHSDRAKFLQGQMQLCNMVCARAATGGVFFNHTL